MVMGSERGALGNLETSSFAEIWSGEELRQFRAGLLAGGEAPAICRGCSLYRGTF
jgi:iron-sulfur cluster protein